MVRQSIQGIVGLLVFVFIAGCKKENASPNSIPSNLSGPKVFIVCEGSLGNGNGSLGLYLPEKDSLFADVFSSINGQNLGDVFQSMIRVDSQYFLCINNSDLIRVINARSLLQVSPVSIPKPRYILPVSNGKAYVSSLFSENIYLLNTWNNQRSGEIALPYRNAEGMLLHSGIAYIACWDTACKELLAINTSTNQLITPLQLGVRAPQEILQDKDGMFWVLSGNVSEGVGSCLTRINPSTGNVLKKYLFPAGADALKPVFNATNDTLYFIEANYNGGATNNGIYRMSIYDAAVPDQPFIKTQGFQYFWALGIQPGTGYIYVGDPKGFTQRGSVAVYKQDGALIKSFLTGIGPGHFYFD